mgnify:CR=1 FL=1
MALGVSTGEFIFMHIHERVSETKRGEKRDVVPCCEVCEKCRSTEFFFFFSFPFFFYSSLLSFHKATLRETSMSSYSIVMAACEVDGKKSAENIDYSITPVQRQASWSAAASQQGYTQMGA